MKPFSKNYETEWINSEERVVRHSSIFGMPGETETEYHHYVIPVRFSLLKELPTGYLVFEIVDCGSLKRLLRDHLPDVGKAVSESDVTDMGNSFDEHFSHASYAIIHPSVLDNYSADYMRRRDICYGVDMFEWIYQLYQYEQAGETGFERPLWGYDHAPDTLDHRIFLKLKETIPSRRVYKHTDIVIDNVAKIKKSCMVPDDFMATLERILDYEIRKIEKATAKQLNAGLTMDDRFKRDVLPVCEKAMRKMETFGMPKLTINRLDGDHTYVKYSIREEAYNINRVIVIYTPDKKLKISVYNNSTSVFNDKYGVHSSDFGYRSESLFEHEIFGAVIAAYFADRFAKLQEMLVGK